MRALRHFLFVLIAVFFFAGCHDRMTSGELLSPEGADAGPEISMAEETCSVENPSGACPSGFACMFGVCTVPPVDPTPCSAANPVGQCDSGLVCSQGTCVVKTDDSCSAANPTGSCASGYICARGSCIAENGCTPPEGTQQLDLPTPARPGKNLFDAISPKEGDRWIPQSWSTAVYDANPSSSRTADGSGAEVVTMPKANTLYDLKLCYPYRSTSAWTRGVEIEKGKRYTFSAYVKSDRGNEILAVFPTFYKSSGGYCTYGEYRYAIHASGEWQEIIGFFTPPDNCFLNGATISAADLSFWGTGCTMATTKVLIDDVFVGEGITPDRLEKKKVFDGAKVKVDEFGNFSILKGGTFEDFFPYCVYVSNDVAVYDESDANMTKVRALLEDYRKHGINCIQSIYTWGDLDTMEKLVKVINEAGLMVGIDFTNAAYPVSHSKMYDYVKAYLEKIPKEKQVPSDTTKAMAEYLQGQSADPYIAEIGDDSKFAETLNLLKQYAQKFRESDGILLYNFDNELRYLHERIRSALQTIHQYDPNHPTYMLLNPASMIAMYDDSLDLHGAYVTWSLDEFAMNNYYYDTRMPAALTILSPGATTTIDDIRVSLYLYVMNGGKGISFNKDPLYFTDMHFSELPFWAGDGLLNLKKEMDALLPVIKAPPWTAWQVTPSDPSIFFGTRDYEGEGYVFAVNPTTKEISVTFTVTGLPYMPSGAEGYFTDLVPAAVSGSQEKGVFFTIKLPPMQRAVYRLAAPDCID
jgi:hypothetical protein